MVKYILLALLIPSIAFAVELDTNGDGIIDSSYLPANIVNVPEVDGSVTNEIQVGDGVTITGTGALADPFVAVGGGAETDPEFASWLSSFDPFETGDETDPSFSAWLSTTPPIYSEDDPDFASWLSSFDPFETSDETDPVFGAWLIATPPLYSEVDGSTTNEIEVADEVFNATNFNGGTTSAVSQDDFYDRFHLFDADDDGVFTDETWFPSGGIDWTTDQGAVNIHSGNYTDTNTTYSAGTGMALDGTTFNCTVVDTNTTYAASDFDIKDLTDSTSLRSTWSGKQDALGFTPLNAANLRTTFQATPDDTHYPSEKLTKDSLDGKAASSHSHTGADLSGIDIGDDTNLAGTANEIVLTGDTLSLHADIARDSEIPRTCGFCVVIDGGGSEIADATEIQVVAPIAMTITSATALADVSGSIEVDIWKDTYANAPPTVADDITASAPVAISSATKSQDSTLTGWTTTVSAGDVLIFHVNSCTTIERATICIGGTR